jgi:serine/threonine protein kinase
MTHRYNIGDTVLGNWKLARFLGAGSFGRVFEAERADHGTIYKAAVKIITIPQRPDDIVKARAEGMGGKSIKEYFHGFVEDIVKECALMSRLKGNSNIVSYEDHTVVEHEEDIGWDIIIRMELLKPLLHLTVDQHLAIRDVMKLGIDMCKALELCQKYHIVHRDIKPDNIFVSEVGDFKLGDFGIARMVEKTTGELSAKGTYTYMAPEVYRGEAYGPCVDIYSLGIVLYQLLNDNRTPFLPQHPTPITNDDRDAARGKRFSGVTLPGPRNAGGRLTDIVLKACAYSSKDRYAEPEEMRADLESILTRVTPPSIPPAASKLIPSKPSAPPPVPPPAAVPPTVTKPTVTNPTIKKAEPPATPPPPTVHTPTAVPAPPSAKKWKFPPIAALLSAAGLAVLALAIVFIVNLGGGDGDALPTPDGNIQAFAPGTPAPMLTPTPTAPPTQSPTSTPGETVSGDTPPEDDVVVGDSVFDTPPSPTPRVRATPTPLPTATPTPRVVTPTPRVVTPTPRVTVPAPTPPPPVFNRLEAKWDITASGATFSLLYGVENVGGTTRRLSVKLWNSNGTEIFCLDGKGGNDSSSFTGNSRFSTSRTFARINDSTPLRQELVTGRTYRWQAIALIDGVAYNSPEQSFTFSYDALARDYTVSFSGLSSYWEGGRYILGFNAQKSKAAASFDRSYKVGIVCRDQNGNFVADIVLDGARGDRVNRTAVLYEPSNIWRMQPGVTYRWTPYIIIWEKRFDSPQQSFVFNFPAE